MDLQEFLNIMNSGKPVKGFSDIHIMMTQLSQEAMQITSELNGSYHTPEEIRELFSKLIGKPVDDHFGMFPPFYTDCGKNITIGKGVFINMSCHFQDQGGITIGDDCLIGHNTVMASLNHDLDPDHRGDLLPAPIVLGRNVWVGAGATILAGVTIGDDAVVAAGAVVTKDVPARTVVVGSPARVVKEL